MKIFDTVTTRAALPFDRLVPALARAFADGAEVPTRHVHAPPGGTVLIMPAWQGGAGGVGVEGLHAGPGYPGERRVSAQVDAYGAEDVNVISTNPDP